MTIQHGIKPFKKHIHINHIALPMCSVLEQKLGDTRTHKTVPLLVKPTP